MSTERYSFSLTTFSPSGKLMQIEYALNAVKGSAPSVGTRGSWETLRRLLNLKGKVLYIGDHIYGDVLRSKKTTGWHTFLVVPELRRELAMWTDKRDKYERLQQLESEQVELHKRDKPTEAVADSMFKNIQEVTQSLEQQYGVFGSLFRSGTHTSFFASQLEQYADLYASSCFNLVHYSVYYYFFRAPMALMPHESTVDHGAAMPDIGSRQNMDEGGSDGAGALKQQSTSTAPNGSIEEEGGGRGEASSEDSDSGSDA